MTATQICRGKGGCGRSLPADLEHFRPSRTRTGLGILCLECDRKRVREHARRLQANPEWRERRNEKLRTSQMAQRRELQALAGGRERITLYTLLAMLLLERGVLLDLVNAHAES